MEFPIGNPAGKGPSQIFSASVCATDANTIPTLPINPLQYLRGSPIPVALKRKQACVRTRFSSEDANTIPTPSDQSFTVPARIAHTSCSQAQASMRP